MILDFHTHTFPDVISKKIIAQLAAASWAHYYTDASRPALFASMKTAGIDYALNLPVFTRPDQVVKINRDLLEDQPSMLAKHYLTLGGMHPDFEGFREELRFLKSHGIPGIKLHPANQGVDLDDPRMLRIIAAASELDMIVVIHAGFDPMCPQRNYATIPMILRVIEEICPPRFVLAHLGGFNDWTAVERELCGAPVYMDTALAFNRVVVATDKAGRPIHNRPLDGETFARFVRRHGENRILFGTDSPWADQREIVRSMQAVPLTEAEKERVFWRNAAQLLQLPEPEPNR